MKFIDFILEKYKIISPILIILLLSHLLFGKPRWQVYPLYLLVVIYLLGAILNSRSSINLIVNMKKWFLGIEMFLLFVSAIALIIFPIEEIPNPSGKYSIGTRSYDIVDRSRETVYSDELSDYRKIKIQAWYPTDDISGYERKKWIGDGTILTRQLASNMGFPFFMLDHTSLIESHSFKNAPISDNLEKYPLVIISHGWLGFREFHTDFAEELASNGYIAISIDHTYGSQAVKFENGDIAYLKPEILPDLEGDAFAKHAIKLVKTYGEDVVSVMDQLENLNANEEFGGKLNLDKIGLLGHSTGGGGDFPCLNSSIPGPPSFLSRQTP